VHYHRGIDPGTWGHCSEDRRTCTDGPVGPRRRAPPDRAGL